MSLFYRTFGREHLLERKSARAIRPAHFCCGARVNRTARANYCSIIAHVGKMGDPVAAGKVCALMPSLTIAVANSLLRQN